MINDTMDRVDGPASPDFCHSDTLDFVLPDPEAVNAVGENEYCTPLFIATKVEAAPISTAVPIRGLAIIACAVGAIAALRLPVPGAFATWCLALPATADVLPVTHSSSVRPVSHQPRSRLRVGPTTQPTPAPRLNGMRAYPIFGAKRTWSCASHASPFSRRCGDAPEPESRLTPMRDSNAWSL